MNNKKIILDRYFILLASGLMMFLINFDIPGVNLAVPEMMLNYNAPIDSVQWIVISYTLMASVFMIILSTLSKHIGSKIFFLVGVFLFSIASIIISIGTSIQVIVFGRMIQGVGMAFVYPQIMAQCTAAFPVKHKGLIISIITFIACFAQAVAPVLSSFLINYMGWESIFLLNVPCGIIIFFLATKYFIKDEKIKSFKFDYFGALLLAIILLTIGLIFPFYSQISTIYLYLYLVILLLLIISSYYLSYKKLINIFSIFSLFKNKQFAYSTFIRVLFMSVFGAFIFAVNIMLREILHISVLYTGLFFLLLTTSLSVSTLFTGFKISKIGYKKGFIIGNSLMLLACFILFFIKFNYFAFSIGLIIFGLGLGINMTTSSAGAITAVEQDKAGLASSIFFTAVFLSFSGGTSLAASILNSNTNLIHLDSYYTVIIVCLIFLFAGLLLSCMFRKSK